VVFCNEGPEYYEYLSRKQPETLLQLYQGLNPGNSIVQDDLYDPQGKYNPRNHWNNSSNNGTIMHLIQGANTLGAECNLGGRATVIRKNADGKVITSADELIRCSGYGHPDRFSDPTIGIQVNGLARAGYMITINNPIALYLHSVDLSNFSHPDYPDLDPEEFWKWDRGETVTDEQGNTFEYHMRATFEVPADRGFVLGDLKYKNVPFEFGSQVTHGIRVVIHGRAYDTDKPLPGHSIEPRSCSEAPPLPLFGGMMVAANVGEGEQAEEYVALR